MPLAMFGIFILTVFLIPYVVWMSFGTKYSAFRNHLDDRITELWTLYQITSSFVLIIFSMRAFIKLFIAYVLLTSCGSFCEPHSVTVCVNSLKTYFTKKIAVASLWSLIL